ncbi:hypothetical protein F5Y19DRAFT_176302 [Xylariaceae sp. FL1651]|nr:hypothetical protein F5Y19DRAFT_176302 [Xylariaceae sp. FL1651]
MCGDHHSRQSLGGALAVLSPPLPGHGISSAVMAGQLVFHDQGKGGLTATHVMFTINPPDGIHRVEREPFLVRIHETGDLTSPAVTSPFWTTLRLKPALAELEGDNRPLVDVVLGQPMNIEVGVNGIIGRRVSVWTQHGLGPVAEGIIGYN